MPTDQRVAELFERCRDQLHASVSELLDARQFERDCTYSERTLYEFAPAACLGFLLDHGRCARGQRRSACAALRDYVDNEFAVTLIEEEDAQSVLFGSQEAMRALLDLEMAANEWRL